jgi:hypothetical protein
VVVHRNEVGTDEIRLVVPASPEFLRMARVAAAGLASRLGFGYDQIEDLRLAVDELCFAIAGPVGRIGTVELRYLVSDRKLVIEGQAHLSDDKVRARRTQLSEVLLAALVDSYELADGPYGPCFSLVKVRDHDEHARG